MDAIKYSKLIDVGHFYGGLSGKSKDDFEDGNAKFITYMNVFTNPSLKINVDDKVRIEEGEKQNTVEYGDVIFTGSSETPEECGMSSVLEEHTDEPLYLNSFCFGYRFNDMLTVVPAYFKHLFRSNSIRAKITKTANGVTRFNVSKKLFGEIEIPIPPIMIQEKIANQLDAFSSVIVNLETELVSRQKQYEYFREELLKFDKDECVWRLVSDFSSVLRGKRLTRNMLSDSNTYPVYHGGNEPIGYYTEYNRPACTVMVINVGASAGTVGFCDKDFWSSDGCFCLKKNEGVNDKFLYHSLKVRENEIMTKVRTAGIPTLDNKVVENIVLPIPSFERQQEIVTTLDTFESLIENIKHELEARKKQYEYYREQLLTFE